MPWGLLQFGHHVEALRLVKALSHDYRPRAALWSLNTDPAGFQWLDGGDHEGNTLSYLRFGEDGSALACAVNLSPVPREGRRIGLPFAGRWNSVINTDHPRVGGQRCPAPPTVQARAEGWQGQPYSADITLPPLAAVWFEPEN